MKPLTSIDARIRAIREGYRTGQPLDYRIKLVRERHEAAKKIAPRTIQVRLDRHP